MSARRGAAGGARAALGGLLLAAALPARAQTPPTMPGGANGGGSSASVGGKLWSRFDAVLDPNSSYEDAYEWRNKFLLAGESLLGGETFQRVHVSALAEWNVRQSYETRYDETVDLYEGYADLSVAETDLRVGQQLVRWGRADVSVLDVLNPPDLTEFLFIEDELAKIPAPMVHATHYFADTSLEAVWIPFYVPPRIHRIGTNWSPILPSSLDGIASQGADVEEIIRDQNLPGTRDDPPPSLWNGSGGLRLSGHGEGFDWGAESVYAWSQVPYFEFSPSFLATVQQQAPTPNPLDRLSDVSFLEFLNHDPRTGDPLYTERPHRQATLGLDGSTTWGRAGLRGEVAGILPTMVYSEDLVLLERPALTASLGVDGTLWGDLYGNLGGVVNWILASDAEPYLFVRPFNFLASAFLREPFLSDRLTLEVRALYDATLGDGAVSPKASWALSDAWTASVGVNVLWGPPASPFGYFAHSSYAYGGLKLSF